MKKLQYTILGLLSLVFMISCTAELEVQQLEDDPQAIETETTQPSTSFSRSTDECESKTIFLQVEYLNPDITEQEKEKIRERYGKEFTIYKIFVSEDCFYFEIWEADCKEYTHYRKNCIKNCQDNDEDADVKRLTPEVTERCFQGVF